MKVDVVVGAVLFVPVLSLLLFRALDKVAGVTPAGRTETAPGIMLGGRICRREGKERKKESATN